MKRATKELWSGIFGGLTVLLTVGLVVLGGGVLSLLRQAEAFETENKPESAGWTMLFAIIGAGLFVILAIIWLFGLIGTISFHRSSTRSRPIEAPPFPPRSTPPPFSSPTTLPPPDPASRVDG